MPTELRNYVESFGRRTTSNIASSSREELLDFVRDMRDDLREDIRSSKETLPSNNTINGPNEMDMIIASHKEMGVDPHKLATVIRAQ
ncbi:hypothetical protein L484_000823 [Morus notabilis]|uniref:Uncharacterized protein n=1 Tax=Morus notabilis TaxID=981085 RepID=W9R7Z2_9ROSA|nr:hypothetical protein L484_000823 [Morus notabilis]